MILEKLFRLDNKIVVITGASGLLGKKHAEAIASYGGTPVLLDLSQKDLNIQSGILNKKYNVNSIGFAVDITNELQVKNNMDLLIDKFGKIDCLINNAANNPKIENISENNFSRLENFPLDVWYQDLNVGLTGSLLCSKYYGLQISKNSHGGSIVNISSDLGLISPDQRLYHKEDIDLEKQNVKPVSYSVVKSGIIGLTRYLATYWADKNVRCNAICPGGVYDNQKDDFLKEINFRIPMGRMANNDEFQGTLIWMLSDAASYLNGAIIPVDGGRSTW